LISCLPVNVSQELRQLFIELCGCVFNYGMRLLPGPEALQRLQQEESRVSPHQTAAMWLQPRLAAATVCYRGQLHAMLFSDCIRDSLLRIVEGDHAMTTGFLARGGGCYEWILSPLGGTLNYGEYMWVSSLGLAMTACLPGLLQ
jgi:hypothetical protein